MEKPRLYRTSKGEVFQDGSQLSLHNGYWWWDVGCPVAPEGAEMNLPLYDEPEPVKTPVQNFENEVELHKHYDKIRDEANKEIDKETWWLVVIDALLGRRPPLSFLFLALVIGMIILALIVT